MGAHITITRILKNYKGSAMLQRSCNTTRILQQQFRNAVPAKGASPGQWSAPLKFSR